MADLVKSDVRTSIRELIANEFGSNNNGKNVLADNLKATMGGYRDEQRQPIYNKALREE